MLVETVIDIGYLSCDQLIDTGGHRWKDDPCEWALGAALCGGL